MSLRQRLKLELADETVIETVYDGRDLRAWETKYKRSALSERMSLSMLTWLGWSAAKRDGSINGRFDGYEAFDAECVDVQGMKLDPTAEEEESPDPPEPPSDTQSTPSAG